MRNPYTRFRRLASSLLTPCFWWRRDLLVRVALEDGQVLWVSEAAHDQLHCDGKLGSPPPVAETSSTPPPPAAGGDEGLQPAPAPSPQPEPQTSGQTTSSPSAVAARRDQAVTRLGSRSGSHSSPPGFERLDITEALAKLLAEARQAKKDSEAAPDDAALQSAFVEKRRLYKQAKEKSQARSTQSSSGASGATSGEANQLQQQIARMQRENLQNQQVQQQMQERMEQRMERLQASVDSQSTQKSATCALM